ncbi:hypothetical protein EV421DRAFT_1908796 [Armillaria borealis]|uniref:Uncharacterized protein n=1 Tax=Armillaria borealis TaxID=47425 RepID=A0AA39J395_9AGAR|nr:hypothetical protein EV421DRAFT_1908796 [Armillaria borealis]
MLELQLLLSTSEGASNEECVSRALELSGDVPLVLSFVHPVNSDGMRLSEEGIEMLDMLLDHAPRWKVGYLDVQHGGALFNNRIQHMRGRVPMLERISIEASFSPSGSTYFHDVLTVAPRLSTVAIRDYLGQLVFSWRQIQRLILHGLHDVPYFLHVLRSVKGIKHLTIFPKAVIGIRGDTTDFGGSIILPAVHTLDLISDMNPLFLLSGTILPALEKLHVGQDDMISWRKTITLRYMNEVGGLLSCSGCALTHATFLSIVEFEPAFQDVIAQCPALTYLNRLGHSHLVMCSPRVTLDFCDSIRYLELN